MKKQSPAAVVRAFLRANYGRQFLAPLTGQDGAALDAFAHLLEAYSRADHKGRLHLEIAMGHTVLAMQSTCQPIAKRGIPAILDWPDEERIWARITAPEPIAPVLELHRGGA